MENMKSVSFIDKLIIQFHIVLYQIKQYPKHH